MKSNTGPLIFLGILGVLGIGILLARQGGNKSSSYHANPAARDWELVSRPSAFTLYENEERWELKRGSDRLIEEIVIHRKVTQNG